MVRGISICGNRRRTPSNLSDLDGKPEINSGLPIMATQNTHGIVDSNPVGELVFQPAKVEVTGEFITGILERIAGILICRIGDHLVTRVPHYCPSHPRGKMFRKIDLIWEISIYTGKSRLAS